MKKIIFLLTILSFSILLSACGKIDNTIKNKIENQVKNGDKIEISYSANYEDGNVFITKEMAQFNVGKGEIIQGIDEGVVGMKQGETKEISIQPDKGYGKLYDQLKIQKVAKIIFDRLGINPEKGKEYTIGNLKGLVIGFEGDGANKLILFDINDLQTYKNLIFKISLIKIN